MAFFIVMNSRDTCIFYRSMFESIKELPKENQAELYNAIFEYSLDFVEPTLNGLSLTIWRLIRPVLEKGNTNYINGSKPKLKQIISETQANVKRNESEVEAYKDKDKDKNNDEDIHKDKIINAKASTFKSYSNQDLINQIKPLIDKFGKDTCNSFYSYWSEPLANGKMRLTGEKAWDTHRRLSSWKQREKQPNNNFVKQPQPVFNRSSQGQKYVGDDVI
jgi:hypothetical protein